MHLTLKPYTSICSTSLIYFEASRLISFPGLVTQPREWICHLLVPRSRSPWVPWSTFSGHLSARAFGEIQSVCCLPGFLILLFSCQAFSPMFSPFNSIPLHSAFFLCFCWGVTVVTGVKMSGDALVVLGTLGQSRSLRNVVLGCTLVEAETKKNFYENVCVLFTHFRRLMNCI